MKETTAFSRKVVEGLPAEMRGPDITVTLSRIEWELILVKVAGGIGMTEEGEDICLGGANLVMDTVAATRGMVYDEEEREWHGTN